MTLLTRLLNLRQEELPRVLILYAMIFLFAMGSLWGNTIVEAAFLQQVGVQTLPWLFVAIALVSIPSTAIYTAFADRAANDRLLIAILLIGIIGILLGLVLLAAGLPRLAYPLLYLLIYVPLSDIFIVHFFTYLNGFYDTRAAKRIVPLIVTSPRIASILAGLTMPLVNRLVSPAGVIALWLASLGGMAALAMLEPRLIQSRDALPGETPPSTTSPDHASTYVENLRVGFHYVRGSAFLRWMALSTLLLTILIALLTYHTSEILLVELQTTEAISNFIGLINGLTNLLVLPILLFGLSRLIGRVGLGTANLIFPAGTLAISASLAVWPGLLMAGLAYFDRNAFFASFRNPIDSLLYNAVPLRLKGRARAFIGGFIVPVGSLLGGGLLLALQRFPISWMVPVSIVALALGFAASALLVRRQYARALIQMLEHEDYTVLLASSASELDVADPTTLAWLRRKLEESRDNYELTLFLAQLLCQLGGAAATSLLLEVYRGVDGGRTRAGLLSVLVTEEMDGELVRHLYLESLADPDLQVRQMALLGLEQLAGVVDSAFLSVALPMLSEMEEEMQAQLLPALLRARDVHVQEAALAAVQVLLESASPGARACGIRALARVGQQPTTGAESLQVVSRLLPFFQDPADEVRLETALAMEIMAKQGGLPAHMRVTIIEAISPCLRDSVERVCQATLIILGKLGTSDEYPLLVGALSATSPHLRATAVESLVQIGRSTIPLIHGRLHASNPQLRKMATVALSRISPREFGGLLDAEIMGNLLTIYRIVGLAEGVAVGDQPATTVLLQSALSERITQLTDEVFYLLSSLHGQEAIQLIAGSLRSREGRMRANALEALESLTSPLTASLIAPLAEPGLSRADLLRISEATWEAGGIAPGFKGAIEQLLSLEGDPLLRALAVVALGNMTPSASLTGPDREDQSAVPNPSLPAGMPERRARRRRPVDLLASLGEPSKADTPPPLVSAKPAFFSPAEVEAVLQRALTDPVEEVHHAARAALRRRVGSSPLPLPEEEYMLSTIEKIIFLKEVPFFKGMTIEQLKVLATVCEEERFPAESRIFNQGDPGGSLYVVVSGRVGLEQEKRKGSFARLATIESHSYFGEMNLFDASPRSSAALAIDDTLTLRLRREPLIALARQNPALSLELINVLSARLREANDRIADLARTRPRELHKLYDQFT